MRTNLAYCRACNAPIVWAKSAATGRAIPLERDSVPEADRHKPILTFDPGAGHITHFSSCPDADRFRKGKGAA